MSCPLSADRVTMRQIFDSPRQILKRGLILAIPWTMLLLGACSSSNNQQVDSKYTYEEILSFADDVGVQAPKETAKAQASPTQAKAAPEVRAATPERSPASSAPVSKFDVTTRDCNLQAAPKNGSRNLARVRKGRKIWVTQHSPTWYVVSRKKGKAYIQVGCF